MFKFLMAALIRFVWREYTGKSRPALPPDVYVKRMSAVGIVSALDIGLSNWSYQFITVLLYTMTKSSSVIFILCFSILFGLERARPSLAAVVMFIASGLFMLTYRSTSFNMIGFLMVLGASLLGGIRWTLAQLVMQKNEYGKSHLLLCTLFAPQKAKAIEEKASKSATAFFPQPCSTLTEFFVLALSVQFLRLISVCLSAGASTRTRSSYLKIQSTIVCHAPLINFR